MQALVLVVLRLLLLRLVVEREGCRSLCAVVGAAQRTDPGEEEKFVYILHRQFSCY